MAEPALTLAEQLLLLALDERTGRSSISPWLGIEAGLAGALLLDLARREVLREDAAGHLEVVAEPGGQHPLLGVVAAAIRAADTRRGAATWVVRLQVELEPIKQCVGRSLVDRGVLTEARRRVLGAISGARFPAVDPVPERALREGLRATLLGEREPTEDEALLLPLLDSYNMPKVLVPRDGRKIARKRMMEIARQGTESDAVSRSVRGAQEALILATIVGVRACVWSDGGGGGDGGGGS